MSLVMTILCFAQTDSITLPPYKKTRTLPSFDILMPDSVSHYTMNDLPKSRPVLIILFDPNCDHCKHETEEILQHIDGLTHIQIVMATNADFADLKKFYEHYNLEKFKNIKAGVEPKSYLAVFFAIHNLPYLAMYNGHGVLLRTHEGGMKVENILKVFEMD
jgi:thioredoxin-related protein